MEIFQLELNKLTLDPRLQFRSPKEHVVAKYAGAMDRGDQFPPVLVVLDTRGRYYLADGQHRVKARKQLGFNTVEAEIVEGEFSDALWLSCGSNKGHGLQLTQEAKRKAIRAALRDPILQTRSDREIGRHIGCDHKTVGRMRKLLPGEFPTPPADDARIRKHILRACQVLSEMQLDQASTFEPEEMEQLRGAYKSLERLLDRAKSEVVTPAEGEG